ncbi:MAG: cell division protein FtsA [Candidatus Eisenbacteria bacterium]|nr:cell division protein FtsA [Candidatus Eisenbacteria bacterium]
MAGDNLITGIDIGTTKVSTVIAECEPGRVPKIIGVGMSRSEGVKRGAVVNVEKTVEAVMRSVEEAERMAGTKTERAYVGIAGSHIQGIMSTAVIAVSRSEDEITGEDLGRVLEQARAIPLSSDRRILHVLPIEFAVDDQDGIRNPVGMSGVRLEAAVHIVTAAATSARNVEKCVQRAGLEVKELVLESYASSFSVLEDEEKELGVLLVDLGGGTTDFTLFLGGTLRYTGTIGLGGENVTSDLAIGLRTPLSEAEDLKIRHGHSIASRVSAEREIEIPGIGGRADRVLSHQVLCSIIESRMEEILDLTGREARKTEVLDLLGGGVVLTGGSALLPGVAEMAETILEMPVKIGAPVRIGGLVDEVSSSRFATAVGLVQYGWAREGRDLRRGNGRGNGIHRVRNMLRAFVDQF